MQLIYKKRENLYNLNKKAESLFRLRLFEIQIIASLLSISLYLSTPLSNYLFRILN